MKKRNKKIGRPKLSEKDKKNIAAIGYSMFMPFDIYKALSRVSSDQMTTKKNIILKALIMYLEKMNAI